MLKDSLLLMNGSGTFKQCLSDSEYNELKSIIIDERRFQKCALKRKTTLQAITVKYSHLFEDCPYCNNPKIIDTHIPHIFKQYRTCSDKKCIQKEIAKTNMERYGTHTTLNVNREAIKITQSKTKEARLTKIRNTNMKRYGVPYPLMNKAIHNKTSINNTKEPFIYSCIKCGQDSIWGDSTHSRSMYSMRIKQGYDICLHCLKKNSHRSSAELEIDTFVKSLGFNTTHYQSKEIHFDIVIEEKNTAIEYHGLYWHNDSHVPSTYHQWKHDEAKKRGLNLIQIFEDSWYENKEVVKRMLMGKLGILPIVQARKTKRILVSKSEAKMFLDTWHMSGGKRMGDINNALIFEGHIISISSISSKTGELVRYASSHNIVGGFKKLMHDFRGWTYLDLKYSDEDNNAYIRNGAKFIGFTPIEYWWVLGQKRYDRRSFTANKLGGPEVKTMQDTGYVRVFGTKHAKFSFDL